MFSCEFAKFLREPFLQNTSGRLLLFIVFRFWDFSSTIFLVFYTRLIDVMHFRSSRPDVFCKKGVFRNFTKFTGKYLCQSLFFNKVAGLRSEKRRCYSKAVCQSFSFSSSTSNSVIICSRNRVWLGDL